MRLKTAETQSTPRRILWHLLGDLRVLGGENHSIMSTASTTPTIVMSMGEPGRPAAVIAE